MKTYKHIGAVLCITALAIPAGVAANGPSGTHGKSGQPHGQNQSHHVNSRCKHQPNVGFSLHGTLAAGSTAAAMVVNVTAANKHAKPFLTPGTPNTFAVPAGVTVSFVGPNPFTTQGADVTKYSVHVHGKVVKLKKGCTAANSPAPTIKKVTVIAPDAGQQEQEQD